MSVQIHINGDTATEAVKELVVLASHLSGGQAATTATPDAPKTSRSRSTSKPETDKKDPAPAAEPEDKSVNDDDSDSGHDDLEEEEGNIPTVVELRAKAQEVGSTQENKAKVKALLDKYGSKSISDVPEDKRTAFLKALEGIA